MSQQRQKRLVPWMPPEQADSIGFVGMGGDLTPTTLVSAYSEGVFPWFNEGDPILWWSPDPRAVIEFEGFHVSRRLARTIRSEKFHITLDSCFETVMRYCGEQRDGGTWVTPEMLEAYCEMHRLGHAHSVESWFGDQLAGGIYGLAIGGLFAAESMFFRVTDGSKVALAALVDHLRQQGYELLDIQMKTAHTERLGAVELSRKQYLQRLHHAIRKTQVHFW